MFPTETVQEGADTVVSTVAGISTDLLILGGLFLFLFWYGLHFGKHRSFAIILSVYAAVPIYVGLPFSISALSFLGTSPSDEALSHVIVFGVIFLLLHVLFSRVARGDFPYRNLFRWGEAALLAAVGGGLLLSAAFQVLPLSEVYTFGPTITTLFADAGLRFWWFLAPLAVVFMTTRERIVI